MSEKPVYVAQSFPPVDGYRLKALKTISQENWLEFLKDAGACWAKVHNISEQAIADAIAKEISEMKMKGKKETPVIPQSPTPATPPEPAPAPVPAPAPDQKPA